MSPGEAQRMAFARLFFHKPPFARTSLLCLYNKAIVHHIEGNFHMVQTFTVFADDPTTTKIKTVTV